MDALIGHAGEWAGTNEFRLMPSDPFAGRPATAVVTLGAGGNLASVGYTWEHPDDGGQDGMLVVGRGEAEGSVVCLWGDSWHQQPQPMSLTGSMSGASIELNGSYGEGWGWRITLDASRPDGLRLQMDNVIPADVATAEIQAGPYPVMVMDLRRA
jgi:hypothetical protein